MRVQGPRTVLRRDRRGRRRAAGRLELPDAGAGYEQLRDRVAIYPSAMDSCEVGGEVVQAQEGDFYGGWITSRVVGPFKGAPGTLGW